MKKVKFQRGIRRSQNYVGALFLSFFQLYLHILYCIDFRPFDESANAAFATAMIAPIAVYVYKVMTESPGQGANISGSGGKNNASEHSKQE